MKLNICMINIISKKEMDKTKHIIRRKQVKLFELDVDLTIVLKLMKVEKSMFWNFQKDLYFDNQVFTIN